ncbi:trans-aconitate 2-methyltransferase [Streptomyces sp. NPDC097619]|uniref:trans-aconitate 2-methyltransferase n=1 Tax=Streptomyces sp. NPDC097619 TaxID=3157228 RepID=UPI00332DE735
MASDPTAPAAPAGTGTTPPTWDPAQYLRHADHRGRPFRDLLARVRDPVRGYGSGTRAPRVADLGCGPGNVTALLTDRWPTARVTGFDNSPEMLAAADRDHAGPTPGGGGLDFRHADLADWRPDGPYDLIVSNAALQWVPGHQHSFPAWIAALRPGGVLAFQVPGNFRAPTHRLLRELCAEPRWRDRLDPDALPRPEPVLEPLDYHALLTGHGCAADVWETTYLHLLTGPDPVLDWVKGTALRPVLTALAGDPTAREEFLDAYRARLREAYPPGPAGTVLPFRRLFAVAVKES